MSMQKVVERILSDAQAEAAALISDAENKAAKRLADASAYENAVQAETETDVKAKTDSIFEKRAADARLESSKILLSEKRKTVDSVYELALLRLVALDKEDCLKLATALLEKYAEQGDEVYFSKNFRSNTIFYIKIIIKSVINCRSNSIFSIFKNFAYCFC